MYKSSSELFSQPSISWGNSSLNRRLPRQEADQLETVCAHLWQLEAEAPVCRVDSVTSSPVLSGPPRDAGWARAWLSHLPWEWRGSREEGFLLAWPLFSPDVRGGGRGPSTHALCPLPYIQSGGPLAISQQTPWPQGSSTGASCPSLPSGFWSLPSLFLTTSQGSPCSACLQGACPAKPQIPFCLLFFVHSFNSECLICARHCQRH